MRGNDVRCIHIPRVNRIQQRCKDLNPVRECWRLAALPGAHPCLFYFGSLQKAGAGSGRGQRRLLARTQERPGQDSNPEHLVRSEA